MHTIEHWTSDICKSYGVNFANGVLRRKFGMENLSKSIDGLTVYPKTLLALFWRKFNLNSSNKFVPMIDFTIDPSSDTGIVDIPAFAK